MILKLLNQFQTIDTFEPTKATMCAENKMIAWKAKSLFSDMYRKTRWKKILRKAIQDDKIFVKA